MTVNDDEKEEKLINEVMEESNVDKGSAIAILKDEDVLEQRGNELVLTEEGDVEDINGNPFKL